MAAPTRAKRTVAIRRRRIAPLRQGDLDGLCGVYAIVNALRWLCPRFSAADAFCLFNTLFEARAQRPVRHPLAFIYRGLTRSALTLLVEAAMAWAATALGIHLEAAWLAPHKKQRDRLDTVWRHLERHLGEGAIAIIGIGKASEHWTVAVEINRSHLVLLDSDGRRRLHRQHCKPRRNGRPHYDLQLQWVLALRQRRDAAFAY